MIVVRVLVEELEERRIQAGVLMQVGWGMVYSVPTTASIKAAL